MDRGTIRGIIKSTGHIHGKVQESSKQEWDVYKGDYDVTPKITAQSLNTKDKIMIKDVTVNEIPFHKVGNESGDTVYIGSEVRDGN